LVGGGDISRREGQIVLQIDGCCSLFLQRLKFDREVNGGGVFHFGRGLEFGSRGGVAVLVSGSLVVALVVLVAADVLLVVLLRLVGLAALVVALLFLVLVVVVLVVAGLGLATVLRRLRRAAISIFFSL